MIRSDEQWLSIINSFHSAAIGAQSWETALGGFADVTGSRSAQLAGFDSNTALTFNIMTNVDPELSKAVAGTVSINPRVKPVSEAPVLKVIAEADFMAPEEWRRNPFYQEIAVPWDCPFIAMTNLERQKNTFIVLAAVRSQHEGHITTQQREYFAALAPHVRTAVRTHLALEGCGTAVLVGAMESLAIPVFVCDRSGCVKSLTQAAENLVTTARGLQLKAGRLQACWPEETKALNDAIEAAVIRRAPPGPAVLRTVVVRGRDHDTAPLVLDVFPLPCQAYRFTFAPRVLVVARSPRGSKAKRAAVLQATYALTSAEIQITEYLAEGLSAELIAAKRGVAVETVRTQIKAIMAKLGVSRQVELVVRLGEL
jgi:DNA-binding CsgD family transcriptional regulator